jgi:hypothetical protein
MVLSGTARLTVRRITRLTITNSAVTFFIVFLRA